MTFPAQIYNTMENISSWGIYSLIICTAGYNILGNIAHSVSGTELVVRVLYTICQTLVYNSCFQSHVVHTKHTIIENPT